MRRRDFLSGISATGAALSVPSPALAQRQGRAIPDLTPQTRRGHATLAFDFPGLAIGTADYAEGPTGCTAFSFSRHVLVESDIRGAAPGTIGDYGGCDAICLAGAPRWGSRQRPASRPSCSSAAASATSHLQQPRASSPGTPC